MLVIIGTLLSIGVNLPNDFVASYGVDRKHLLAGLILVVVIALLRYPSLVLLLAVIMLAVGANLPQELSLGLNIDTRFLMPTLIAIVVLSLVNRTTKLTSEPYKPKEQEIVTGNGSIGLHEAVKERRIEIVKTIVDSGIHVDARSEQGFTALMMAASKGHEEILQLLIDEGADLNAVNKQGQTALQIARLAGRQASVDALMVAVMSKATNIGVEFEGVTA